MYFPYIRERQYELLALRELATKNLLENCITPVVESVKLSPTLIKTIEEYIRNEKQLAIVGNPTVGSFMKEHKSAKKQSREEK